MINYKKKIVISGKGICIGSITDSLKLIEHIVENKRSKTLKSRKNEIFSAVQEAVRGISEDKTLTAYTDTKLERDIKQAFSIKDVFQCTNVMNMFNMALDDLKQGITDYAILLSSTSLPQTGCVSITLTMNSETDPEIELVQRGEEKNFQEEKLFEEASATFQVIVDILCATIEVTSGIQLLRNMPQDYLRYLWRTTEKRSRYVYQEDKNNGVAFKIKQAQCKKDTKLFCSKFLLPVSFSNNIELVRGMEELKKSISFEALDAICYQAIKRYLKEDARKQTIVFIIPDIKTLLEEISEVQEKQERFLEENFQWESKNGSFFISRDPEKEAKIVCMNPPGGMVKKGIYFRTYSLFPFTEDIIEENYFKFSDDSNQMISDYLYEAILNQGSLAILKKLGIEPQQMIGASMGEISMFFSRNTLASRRQGVSSEEREREILEVIKIISNVFNKQPELGLRYFKRPVNSLDKWYLKCSLDKVKKVVEKEKTVFLFIIGSKNDVIISGESAACIRVIKELGCVSSRIHDSSFVHTEVLEPAMPEVLKALERLQEYIPVNRLDYEIYSTYFKRPFDESCSMYSENICNILSKTVDFAGVVECIYQNSGRIFFDLSSGNLCGTWVKECLAQKKDFKVLSLYEQGDCVDNILKVYAVLMSFHAKVNYEGFLNLVSFPVCKKEQGRFPVKEFYDSYLKQQMIDNRHAFKMYLKSEEILLQQILEMPQKENCIWNRKEIEHMTEFSMADILGEKYREADYYAVRARMPLPPFLFVSRILKINAEFGKYEPSSIIMEYDIDENFPVRIGKYSISNISLGEASHIGIFLCAYIGIDVMSKGKLKFRITNATTTVVTPHTYQIGEVLRVIYRIEKFVKRGDTMLVFCSYAQYIGRKQIGFTKAIGGFFTQQDLDSATGINEKAKKPEKSGQSEMLHFSECRKKSYGIEETRAFYSGNIKGCFGSKTTVNLKVPMYRTREATFVDRILEIKYNGGDFHCGYICSEKKITPDFWPFRYHFKNDPVLPGTIMLEGLNQTAEFLFAYAGLTGYYSQCKIQLACNQTYNTIFRGQVHNVESKLKYELHVLKSEKKEDGIYVTLCGDVTWEQMHVIHQENIIYKIERI